MCHRNLEVKYKMYKVYDKLPFGVIILKGCDLSIEYMNPIFLELFNIETNNKEKNIKNLIPFHNIERILKGCFENKTHKKLRKINALRDRYFDFTIAVDGELLQVYFYEVTEFVAKESKLIGDNEKLLKIWSEIKTKCDILQQLRVKEKEYVAHFKNIVNNLSEGLIVFDGFGKLDFFNKAASELSNMPFNTMSNSREFFQNLDYYNFNKSNYSLEELHREYLQHLNSIDNFIVKLKDEMKDDFKYIEVNCKPIKDEDNNLINTIITMKDITEIKSNEMKLEKISESKDELFNMISHELRTPLTIIQSSLQLAKDIYKNEIGENIEKILYRVDQNCKLLLKLINNILDVSKADAGFLKVNYTTFDIVLLTEDIVSSANYYAQSKGVDLIFDTTDEEIMINLDRDKYEKIILNILSNAIKFTPKGKGILLSIKLKKDYVQISVKDEGVGIPEEKVHRIFERFIQIDNPLSNASHGTGLGLSLVKRFVELMKGHIDVKSKLGEGTEFILKFNLNKSVLNNKEDNSFQLDFDIDNKIILELSDINL